MSSGISKLFNTINDPLGLFTPDNYQGSSAGGKNGILGKTGQDVWNLALNMGIPAKEPETQSMIQASNAPTVERATIEDEGTTARREFYLKQALLSSRKGTTKTSSLGVASDVLQTNRKSLLGGM